MVDVVRIVTNLVREPPEPGIELDYFARGEPLRLLALYRRVAAADMVVWKMPPKHYALGFALIRMVRPRKRLVYYDVLIPVPENLWQRLKRRLYLTLVRRADLILTVHADVEEYARLLRLPRTRLQFVGFKSNLWEDTVAVERGAATEGKGHYVLACGQSYRDFATFTAAMAEAGVPARILLSRQDLRTYGSIPPPSTLPPNVDLLQHDGTRKSWVEALLGARIVVVPLRGDVINAAVSVPLEAMNLSRPLIVTEGPATRSMLDDSVAGVVPPHDPHALAAETVRLWENEKLQGDRVRRAREYVSKLGGVERMSRDVMRAAVELFKR